MIAAVKDPDLYVRYRAANGLQAFRENSRAVAALLGALGDSDVVIQNRAAVSLAIALVKGSTIKPRLGLESAIGILETRMGPLPPIELSPAQQEGLDALSRKFGEFGDRSTRPDLDWGFRPVGNAILAFGLEGGKRLQAMIDQGKDHRLATLAWQVLNIRQGMENFGRISGEAEQNAEIYRSYPGTRLPVDEAPSPLKWDPTDKDK